MMTSPQSFGVVSSRSVSSSRSGLVSVARWCPVMDLLAVLTADTTLHVHRLNWQRIIAIDFTTDAACKSAMNAVPDGVCAASSLAWRPDGKALCIGFHSGLLALVSIETKTVVATWQHAPNSEAASITSLQWVEWPPVSARSLQCRYLSEFAPRLSSSRLLPTQTTPTDDTADTFFSTLPPIDTIGETFAMLATPVGGVTAASGPSQVGGVQRSSRGSSGTSSSSPTAPVLNIVAHDAFEVGRLTLLLAGDAAGSFRARACGTLEVLQLSFDSASILRVDLGTASGLLNIATRDTATHRAQLHTLWSRALLTHAPEVTLIAQHLQQAHATADYVAAAIDQMAAKWKVARKSFDNKMLGLMDVISEFASDAADRGLTSSADPDTDASSELLEFLSTGIPSYAVHQFVTRNLSAGNFEKTLTLVDSALVDIHAIATLAIAPAAERLAFRAEELRAASRWSDRFSDVGLVESSVADFAQASAALLLAATTIARRAATLRQRYACFGAWMVAGVRLINNEHEASPAPSADATDLEKDSQAIPTYGPYDTNEVATFLERDLDEDHMGQEIGDVKRAATSSSSASDPVADAEEVSRTLHIPGYAPPCPAPSASIALAWRSLTRALENLARQPSRVMSAAVESRPWHGQAEAEALLFEAAPLIPASSATHERPTPLGNITGTPRGIALRSSNTRSDGKHLLAFLWSRDAPEEEDGAAQQQLVTVLTFHTASTDSTERSSPKHLTILVPNTHSVDAVEGETGSGAEAQVMSLDFYDADSLHILVRYRVGETILGTKMWLVDLNACEDAWSVLEEDQVVVAAGGDSLVSSISAQFSDGSARLASLLPPTEEDSLVHAPTRSRLFRDTCAGDVALNALRSLAVVLVSGRGANTSSQPGDEDDDEKHSQPMLLLQHPFKPTRRVILIDMDEDDEEDEAEEEVEAEGDAEIEADADADVAEDALGEESMMLADVDAMHESTPTKPSSTRSSLGPVHYSGSKTSVGFSSPLVTLLSLVLVLMALLAPTSVVASAGDRDYRFQYCLTICTSRCRLLDAMVREGVDAEGRPHPLGSDPFTVLPADHPKPWRLPDPPDLINPSPNTWLERNIFGWTCSQNCGYECMHANVVLRESLGESTVKYYGKWPFTRVLGMQELLSTVFSMLNALPHIYWFFRIRRAYGHVDLPMIDLWSAYGIVYTNTWLWSAVFHARDFTWTERLDYFCASAGITFSLCVAIIRTWRIDEWRRRLVYVFLPACLLLAAHIGYLQLVHFDYGWNMRVSLAVGVAHSTVWLYNSARNWSDGHHWRMVFVSLALWACASLEVFDFPPIFGLLDAHAAWHGLTPVLGYMLYLWIRDDIEFQIKQAAEDRQKRV